MTTPNLTLEDKKSMAAAVRMLSADAVEKAQSGHPGLPLGAADVATVLFADFLNFNPADPAWPNRDRFVLSAGHGSLLLYSLLHLTGYGSMTMEELQNFRQLGSLTPGHPEVHHTPGVETTTGPLGQGLANAVGMALGQELLAARVGEALINNYTYALVGDGCLMEGISQEAISLAGHLRLKRLIVLFDDNGITIDGATDLSTSEDMQCRFAACGWHCQQIDGHDYGAIAHAIQRAKDADKPSMIACRTKIGFGAPTRENTNKAHGAPLGAVERAGLAKKLGWAHPPFVVPQDIYTNWEKSLGRCKEAYAKWHNDYENAPPFVRQTLQDLLDKKSGLTPTIVSDYSKAIIKAAPNKATRVLSQQALETIAAHVPGLVGGSADLTGSNNTKTNAMKPVMAGDFSGSYIYYGIREHAMGAVMNGLTLYGGIIPYGGTFLTFSDYMRPAIRLAALMGAQTIFVMTHDSIGLGEDGPTHQPIEHLAALRAIPNLYVFRPCDGVETIEAWAFAIGKKTAPSLMALTRQNVPTLRQDASQNWTLRGGYVLRHSKNEAQVVLLATGSEVSVAVEVQEALENEGIPTQVSSMPCLELFDTQPATYRQQVLGPAEALRVSIEAGCSWGWGKYVGNSGLTVGINEFGASAPAAQLFAHYGLTSEKVLEKIRQALKN